MSRLGMRTMSDVVEPGVKEYDRSGVESLCSDSKK